LSKLLPYLVVPHLLSSDRAAGKGALASVPLLQQTTFLGLLLVELGPAAGDFTVPDLDEISAVGAQASLVLERMRADAAARHRQRLARDMDLAREIQRRFLPSLANQVQGFRVAAEYRPAFEVGGDFYDVVPAGNGRIIAVVGDVSGKGVPAALTMSRVSSDFRRLARTGLSAGSLLAQLNQLVCEHTTEEVFVTAVCLCLDARAGRLEIANAGHVLPLLRRKIGVVEKLGEASGLPLGMLPGQSYEQQEVPLSTGDIVLLMTDGVVEALDSDADRLGGSALADLVATAPPDILEINRRILDEIAGSNQDRPADDVTLLTVEAIECRDRIAA
jgi:serine phosphatase RsbU (regulator of sigma subunit)